MDRILDSVYGYDFLNYKLLGFGESMRSIECPSGFIINRKCIHCLYLLLQLHVKWRLHIAIGMQTRLQTGLQTGVSSVCTERLVCKPVCQPIVVTFTHDDWFAYRYAYRFANPTFQTLFTFWPRPLESLVTQCLRRRNNSSCSLQMEDA